MLRSEMGRFSGIVLLMVAACGGLPSTTAPPEELSAKGPPTSTASTQGAPAAEQEAQAMERREPRRSERAMRTASTGNANARDPNDPSTARDGGDPQTARSSDAMDAGARATRPDSEIVAEIQHAIAANEILSLGNARVFVSSTNGQVTLKGIVRDEGARDAVAAIARKTAGVVRIVDLMHSTDPHRTDMDPGPTGY